MKAQKDGSRTLQGGSKTLARHLKTLLNACNALSRGVVQLFYHTEASSTLSFGSGVVSLPSTQ